MSGDAATRRAWPPPLPVVRDSRLATRLAGRPGLFLLDVDGTLAPIVERPELAAVPSATRAAVSRLATAPLTHVALVSGRAAPDARRLVDVAGVWAIGNHGFETIAPDGTATVDERVAPHLGALRIAAESLDAVARDVEGALLEDKRLTLTLHYRQVAPDGIARLREAAAREAESRGLVLTEGKMVLELRPPVRGDKGTASLALAARLGADGPETSLLFAGDDVTDEHAFRALRERAPHAVTVRVGDPGPTGTAAELLVPNTAAFAELLEWVGELRGR